MAFVKLHQNCDDCGSSDALSYNEDGSSYCFACAKFTPSSEGTGGSVSNIKERVVPGQGFDRAAFAEPYKGYQDRGLTATTMAAYSAQQKAGNILFGYHTPQGELTAVKDQTEHAQGEHSYYK